MNYTLGLIAVTALVSWAALQSPPLMRRLILWPPAVHQGREYHRLFTYGWIHADLGHLAFNMITLYFFGRVIERLYLHHVGVAGFLAFYGAAIVVSILPSYADHRNDAEYRTLGASGAVSAVLFSYILLEPWSMLYIIVLPVPAIVYAVAYTAYSVWRGRQAKDAINHSAHLWGAAFGVAVTALVKPNALAEFVERLMHPSWGIR